MRLVIAWPAVESRKSGKVKTIVKDQGICDIRPFSKLVKKAQ